MTELLIGCSCIAGLGIAAVAALAWFARHLLYRIWCYIRLQRRREFVIANGIHVKAVVVQANMTLFAPSDEDDPAQVILTFDNNLPDAVSFLRGVAERMAALKDTQGDDSVDRQVAEMVTDETFIPGLCLPLPAEFTGGRRVYVAHVMLERKYLPNRCLPAPQGYIQCITMPDGNDAVHMIPYVLEAVE